jgi:hypothetical protein
MMINVGVSPTRNKRVQLARGSETWSHGPIDECNSGILRGKQASEALCGLPHSGNLAGEIQPKGGGAKCGDREIHDD